MFTDPQIYNPQDMTLRGFISFHYDGKRYRFYNGKPINVSCAPNKRTCKTHQERERLLKQLQREYTRALLKGWIPEVQKVEVSPKPIKLPLVGYSEESLPAFRDECLPVFRCKVYQRLGVDNSRMLVRTVQ